MASSLRDCKQYSEREKVNDGIKGYHLVFSTQRGQENVKLREELQKNESFISRMLKVFGK